MICPVVQEVQPIRCLTPEQQQRAADNLPLIYFVLGKMSVRPDQWEQAVSDGQLGLVKAAMRYDPAKGEFSTYAFKAIWGAVLDGIRKERRFRKAVPFRLESEWGVGLHKRYDTLPRYGREGLPDRREQKRVALAAMLLADLPARDRAILVARSYGETLDAIGQRIGRTRERVRQIEARALARVRQRLRLRQGPSAGRQQAAGGLVGSRGL